MSSTGVDLAERVLRGTTDEVRAALEGRELSRAEARTLLRAQGRDLQVLCVVGDLARAEDVGEEVSYVINRNINFTNICYVGCSFCGFSRHKHDEDAYDRGLDDIVGRAREAWEVGASEICIQGGIHPHFGHQKSRGMSLRDYLVMLREEGLDTIPGTAAEILDDEIRKILSPRKLMTDRWVEIVTTAHAVGLRSSSTLMYGHIETDYHVAAHFDLLRSIQKDTGGFTEFVPLGFIHPNTSLYAEQGSRAGASMAEDLRVVAVARLFLRPWIRNVQVSWVKMGPKLAQLGLLSGANDFGGTLMEESISKAAGSEHGDNLPVEEIQRLIRELGRIPYERTTTYDRRKQATARLGQDAAPVASAARTWRVPLGSGY
jgi:FO synthase